MAERPEYSAWTDLRRVEVRMIEKNEKCRHEVGDTFYYENPYKPPSGVCHALLHVFDLYIWRIALARITHGYAADWCSQKLLRTSLCELRHRFRDR